MEDDYAEFMAMLAEVPDLPDEPEPTLEEMIGRETALLATEVLKCLDLLAAGRLKGVVNQGGE